MLFRFSTLAIVFIVPFTGLVIFYTGIIIRIARVAREIGIQDAVHNHNVSNVAKMVFVVIITTLICWLPITSYWIIKYSTPTYQGPQFAIKDGRILEPHRSLRYIGQTLIFVHSALQPLIYFLTGTKLRCEFKRMVKSMRRFKTKQKDLKENLDCQNNADVISEDEGFSSCKEEDFREMELVTKAGESFENVIILDGRTNRGRPLPTISLQTTNMSNSPYTTNIPTSPYDLDINPMAIFPGSHHSESQKNNESKSEIESKTSSRKTSFYLDFDPMNTPPSTPKPAR